MLGVTLLPPNSARFSYATEGALFISAQLSSDAVMQSPPKGFGTDKTVGATSVAPKHARKLEAHLTRVKKKEEE